MLRPYNNCTHPPLDNQTPALVIKDLYLEYPNYPKLPVLKNIHLTIPAGKQVALVGHNGAGKSTLLKVIAGLLPYTRGQINIFGHPPNACQHHVAYLPQQGRIDWEFPITVEKFILTGRYVHLGWFQSPKKEDYEKLETVLNILDIQDLRERSLSEISGGERQRALLARTLIHEAQLLLLDEPLNGIDNATQKVIESTLQKLQSEGKTVLMATHDHHHLSSRFTDCIFLNEGSQVTSCC